MMALWASFLSSSAVNKSNLRKASSSLLVFVLGIAVHLIAKDAHHQIRTALSFPNGKNQRTNNLIIGIDSPMPMDYCSFKFL